MFPLTFGCLGTGGNAVVLAFQANTVDGSNLTTYTFASAALGTAAANRKIVVGITATGGTGNTTVSSCTVNGVSGTLVKASAIAAGGEECELWQAEVPSGTTGNIVVVHSGSKGSCAIGVYALYGAALAATDTGISTANPLTDVLDIPAGGVAIGVARCGSSATFTWTNLTETYDAAMEGTDDQTGAAATFPGAQTNLSITCTQSASTTPQMVIASWGPA